MILILKEDVKGLGKKGEKVKVADGYGRNFLIPKGLAFEADAGALQQLQEKETIKADKQQREQQRAKRIAAELEGLTLIIKAKHGEGSRLFGSITNVHVADELKKQKGIEIDRKKIEIKETIKTLGPHDVVIRVYTDVSVKIHLDVQPE